MLLANPPFLGALEPVASNYGEAGEWYGGTQIPLTASTPQGADRLLYYLGQYLQAISNAYAVAEWQRSYPGPEWLLPVKNVFFTDPETYEFNENALPAIFVTRGKEPAQRIQAAEEIRIERGHLRVLWVPPPAPQFARGTREQFGFKLAKVFDKYIEDGRNVAWKIPGDAYPTALHQRLYGSTLQRWTMHRRMWVDSSVPTPFTISADDEKRTYEAWQTNVFYEEEIAIDPQTQGYVPWGGGVAVTIEQDSTPPDPRGPLKDLTVILQ